MAKVYSLPKCLEEHCTPKQYYDWLFAKAATHFVRDTKRGNTFITRQTYRRAIHQAVLDSGGLDMYTGRPMDWHLISTYDNEKSREQGRAYKKGLANLPTVDHVGDGFGPADFKICSWRVNDAKHDLTLEEFVEICEQVLKHQGFLIAPMSLPSQEAVTGTESRH